MPKPPPSEMSPEGLPIDVFPWEDEDVWVDLEWRPAKAKYFALTTARVSNYKHPALIHLEMVHAMTRLYGTFQKNNGDKDPVKIKEHCAERLHQVVQEMMRALEAEDETFFTEMARLTKALFRSGATYEEQILSVAFDLYSELGRNPTRAEVRQSVASTGLRIEGKDWSGYFKRCCLTFLERGRPGRPSKPTSPPVCDGANGSESTESDPWPW